MVDGKASLMVDKKMDIQESDNLSHTQKGGNSGNSDIKCNSCDENFESMNKLMQHKKYKHTESVSVCWNVNYGNYVFGDVSCWFRHIIKSNDGSEVCKIEKSSKCSS